jgi:ribosome biogenesis GTPase
VDDELARLGWDDGWADAFADHSGRGLEPARVAAVDRGAADLLGRDGRRRATFGGQVLDSMARNAMAGACTGDWAGLRTWPDGRITLEALLPRRTAVVRAAATGQSRAQVLAANVDCVLVAMSLGAEPALALIERLVALASESGAQPVVVLTKADLATDADSIAADVRAAAPGADVLVVSAVSGQGMEALIERAAPGRTFVLLGQPGVGKSTLVNAWTGGDSVSVRRRLVPLPGGALLIDTPGLRGVGGLDVVQGPAGEGARREPGYRQ